MLNKNKEKQMFKNINFTKLGINLALFGLKLQGKVPTRYRKNGMKDNKYTISYTTGGESEENFLKITKGTKVYYFPEYERKKEIRKNTYTLNISNQKI
jgi:hypothetical protein|tara:strand:- start:236 stop:529 length:294 start_codon:yes stop_codon:yes gene_type:complete